MRICSIVPRFFPVIDGIGDYALAHARLLREASCMETRFIVADPDWQGPNNVEGFQVTHLARRFTSDLIGVLPKTPDYTVVLHYGGYGYAKRGCPAWLVAALERWRKETGERSLVTIFHELYATGLPWTSAFWLSPLQKNLTSRLARLSDQSLTSLEANARTLTAMSGHGDGRTHHLPVFSSIGEPQSPPALKDRRRRLVVFGTRGRRIEVYRRSMSDLNRICAALGIEEVLDIGQPIDGSFLKDLAVRSSVAGLLPSAEVSELLLDSIAGVIDYPAAVLGKSTIFAAYCSHRVIPIVATHVEASPADGLHANSTYWLTDARTEELNLDEGQAVADRALDWYRQHNLSNHAKLLAACLLGNGAKHNVRSSSGSNG
jgi:hypothetical protein